MTKTKRTRKPRTPKVDFICGVEIECEYNNDLLSINKGRYHSSVMYPFGEYFTTESDGSLRATNWGWRTAEIISRPFPASEYQKVLEDFKTTVIRKSGTAKLNEAIKFNTSCGAHIHISPVFKRNKNKVEIQWKETENEFNRSKEVVANAALTMDIVEKFRKTLRRKVSNAFPRDTHPNFYNRWSRKLNRRYSKFMDTVYEMRSSRYSEWNLFGYHSQTHMEYRSFHLYGIKTWDDFFKIYGCLFETINEVLGAELKKDKPFLQGQVSLVFEEGRNVSSRIVGVQTYEVELEQNNETITVSPTGGINNVQH